MEIDRLSKKIQTEQGPEFIVEPKKKDPILGPSFNASFNSAKFGYQSFDKEYPPEENTEENPETYCYCKGPYIGTMIACDYSECKLKWFHLHCVGITNIPDGAWFCANCKPFAKKKKQK